MVFLTGGDITVPVAKEKIVGGSCPPGRACGVCDGVNVVLERGPFYSLLTPSVPPASSWSVAGPRDGSVPQNLRIWTLGASITAGYYSSAVRWANVWWSAAAAVQVGGFGLAAAPWADIPAPATLADAFPANLSSYNVLHLGRQPGPEDTGASRLAWLGRAGQGGAGGGRRCCAPRLGGHGRSRGPLPRGSGALQLGIMLCSACTAGALPQCGPTAAHCACTLQRGAQRPPPPPPHTTALVYRTAVPQAMWWSRRT